MMDVGLFMYAEYVYLKYLIYHELIFTILRKIPFIKKLKAFLTKIMNNLEAS